MTDPCASHDPPDLRCPVCVAYLTELRDGLQALDYRKTYQQFFDFQPYTKQKEFLKSGASFSERLLIAGNQNGKTQIGAYEAACHLTGLYPSWWEGRRFDKPTKGWIAGETATVVRDVQQKKLCGEAGVDELYGTGMIPKDLFIGDPALARSVINAYDTIQVRHVSGGVSVARFKSYEQGREKFQGETLDWLWFDEEPPMKIYSEGITRTAATKGIVWMTFTPLKGPTEVVNRFKDEPSPYRDTISMSIYDAEHISPDERDRMIASWPVHERDARAFGKPMLGAGAIFTAPEESIIEAPIENAPAYWTKLWGVDFGISHAFGAVLILWDRDNDVIHVHHAYRVKDALPIQHVAAMKPIGAGVPVAWPNDGNIRRDDGKPMADHYKRHGARMLETHAQWPDGSVSTEAGIMEMDEREKSGRLKYARHLSDLLEERRMYHRKDDGTGNIVKLKDDLISALRIAIMAKHMAKAVGLGRGVSRPPAGLIADGTDYDIFE
jgi:phage terminase large subunit-like protein